jgi:hypothetical protein
MIPSTAALGRSKTFSSSSSFLIWLSVCFSLSLCSLCIFARLIYIYKMDGCHCDSSKLPKRRGCMIVKRTRLLVNSHTANMTSSSAQKTNPWLNLLSLHPFDKDGRPSQPSAPVCTSTTQTLVSFFLACLFSSVFIGTHHHRRAN